MKVFKRITLALSTGYVFFFFSERMFWSMWRPNDMLTDNIVTWLAYSALAYIVLIVIKQFNARNMWALFVVGALYGWIGEGVVAMTVFGVGGMPFPWTVSFTALAWHAPITVVAGWYLMRVWMEERQYKKLLMLVVSFGIFWGVWSMALPLETPPIMPSTFEFALHAFSITILLIISHGLFSWADPSSFSAGRFEKIILAVMVVLFALFITIPAVQYAAAVLPILFGSVYIILRKNRSVETGSDALSVMGKPVGVWNSLILLLMPLCATLVYAATVGNGIIFPTNFIVFAITMPLGFILFGVAAWKIFHYDIIKGIEPQDKALDPTYSVSP